ncbi:amyloid beta A4 precursor protein-binding family B member 1-interacting protein-like [Symphalangus syndactylus]|uniref:amyloid beta A4 precursor protein-binding family B member 1-interacting protein-like n=1 Tax=Symphalangus syndactylus TaxID=9590 RepID=UPI002441D97F|nr:amyloid beta A4 precursor protein-binding family B member 1-interacting protein-like [Symphalangus syndactylus]
MEGKEASPREPPGARSTPGPAQPQVQPAPPPPVQRSWDTSGSPATPPKAKGTGSGDLPAPPDYFLPPQPPMPPLKYPELPPPPPDFMETPLDFVLPPLADAKRPPMPHTPNRHEASMFTSSKRIKVKRSSYCISIRIIGSVDLEVNTIIKTSFHYPMPS